MSDLDDFIKQHALTPRREKQSALEPFRAEILQMKEMGFTEKIILQFLDEKKGLQVSQQALNWFIRTRRANKPKQVRPKLNKLTEQLKTGNTVSVIEQEKHAQSEVGNNTFNWQKPIPPEDLI